MFLFIFIISHYKYIYSFTIKKHKIEKNDDFTINSSYNARNNMKIWRLSKYLQNIDSRPNLTSVSARCAQS